MTADRSLLADILLFSLSACVPSLHRFYSQTAPMLEIAFLN